MPPTSSETLLDKLITRLAASRKVPLHWINFVMRHRAVSAFASAISPADWNDHQSISATGQVCHAQYLLQHSRLLISDISTNVALKIVTIFRWCLPGKPGDAQPVASSQFAERLIRHADATMLAATIITIQPRLNTVTGRVLHCSTLSAPAQRYRRTIHEAHMQHPADVVILRRNAGVAQA